jgi:hypothetical protein
VSEYDASRSAPLSRWVMRWPNGDLRTFRTKREAELCLSDYDYDRKIEIRRADMSPDRRRRVRKTP